jgi:DNA-binding transcriptional LysR family regulator
VADAAAEMRDHQALLKGSVRIGITPMMGAVLFPGAFASFRREYPEFQISLVEEGTLSLQAHLEKGEIDIGIMVVSDLPTGLASLPLEKGRIMACMRPGHPLAEYAEIPFGLLRDQPFILFQGDTYSRRMILRECARFRFSPNILFSSSQIGTVMGLVRQGAGIAFFMEELTRDQEAIETRPLADPLVLEVGIAWNQGRYVSKAARAFIDTLRPSSRKYP